MPKPSGSFMVYIIRYGILEVFNVYDDEVYAIGKANDLIPKNYSEKFEDTELIADIGESFRKDDLTIGVTELPTTFRSWK